MTKVVTQRCLEHDLNPRPTDRKPKYLTHCWEERLRNDVFCVEWDLNPSLNQSIDSVMLIWLQLQQLVTDLTCIKLMDLNTAHNVELRSSVLTAQQRSAAEMTYQRRAEQLLTDENCFKLILVSRQLLHRVGQQKP